MLDVRTLLLLMALSALLLGVAQHTFRRPGRDELGMVIWAGSNYAQAVAWLLFAFRGQMADWASVSLANAFLFAGFALQEQAFLRWGRQKPDWFWVVVPSVALAIVLLPLQEAYQRIVVASPLMGWGLLRCAWALRREARGSYRKLVRLLTGFYVLLAIIMFMRGVDSLLSASPIPTFFTQNQLQMLTFVSMYSAVVFLTFGFSLLVNQRLAHDLQRLATLDSLTEVYNRRMWTSLAERELSRAMRKHQTLVLLMMDIDHFKKVNDRYGHLAGDKVLMTFAKLVRNRLRLSDLFGRFGGEEFCLLLPDTGLEEARQLAERLRMAVFEQVFHDSAGRPFYISVSIGMSVLTGEGNKSLNRLIKEADEALYEAKAAGRNQVISSPD